MYTTTVTIPRITRADITALSAVVPNIATIAVIPLVDTEKKASDLAVKKLHKELPTSEMVNTVDSVTVSEDGQNWEVKVTIFGD